MKNGGHGEYTGDPDCKMRVAECVVKLCRKLRGAFTTMTWGRQLSFDRRTLWAKAKGQKGKFAGGYVGGRLKDARGSSVYHGFE